jgi:DNA-binding GntR family transcriptional regulator
VNLPPPDADLEARFPHRHDRAFAYLKRLLFDGGLEPDEVISTEDVARALKISRAPVTDAIKRLVRDGFLTVMPQVGCRICAPQPTEVADFYRLFAKSEAVIIGLAAQRRTASQAAALKSATAEFDRQYRTLRSRGAPGPEFRALNRMRYEAIHDLAASRIAGELVANMWDRSDFYIRVAYGEFVYGSKVHESNQKICRAIITGDMAAAVKETESYLCRVGKQTSKKLAAQSGVAG